MTDYYCQVKGTYGGTASWSFGMNVTSNQGEASLLTTWTNAWSTAWNSNTFGLQTLYPTGTEINELTVATVDQNYKQVSKSIQAVAYAGTSTADTLPYQEAIVVSLRTAMIGRHARGRFFLPAMAEDAVNGDILVLAAQTRVKASITSVQTSIQADGSTFFVVHKPTKNPPTVAGPKYVVTNFLVSNKPARQSRRTAKIRPSYL